MQSLYDRALFWLQMGAAVAVIGGIILTVGLVQWGAASRDNLWSNRWFEVGLGIVGLGVLMLLWSFRLYRKHGQLPASLSPTIPQAQQIGPRIIHLQDEAKITGGKWNIQTWPGQKPGSVDFDITIDTRTPLEEDDELPESKKPQ